MLVDRLPPQDLLAEESVLASCLLDAESLETALNILQPEDFYKKAHQNIFSTFQYLVRNKKPVDLTTVAGCLLSFKKLEEVGGAPYLSELLNNCPMATNIEAYSENVKSKAVLRKLIEVQAKNIDACYSTTDIPETLDNIQKAILSIEINGHKDSYINMADMTYQSIERYEALQEGRGPAPVKTGFPTIDKLTGGGFRGSKLIIIAGRPRMGKTSIMLNMARNMAKNGDMVGIFSIEMDKEELDDRFTASETGINSLKLSSGKWLNADDWVRIAEASGEKSTWPIIIDDTGGIGIMELKRRSRVMKKAGVKIIFIDQLSKIRSAIKGSEYERRTDTVNELAILKKELRIPVVLLAQIRRKYDNLSVKKPTLENLKSTGALEEDTDIVLLLHREYEYTKADEDKDKAELEIAKQRSGPERNILLNWTAKVTLFTERHEEK